MTSSWLSAQRFPSIHEVVIRQLTHGEGLKIHHSSNENNLEWGEEKHFTHLLFSVIMLVSI